MYFILNPAVATGPQHSLSRSPLLKRQGGGTNTDSSGSKAATIAYVVCSVLIIPSILWILYKVYRWRIRRQLQHGPLNPIRAPDPVPPYLETSYRVLAKLGFKPAAKRLNRQRTLGESLTTQSAGSGLHPTLRYPSRPRAASHESVPSSSVHELPQRSTSVRSIQTLPEYHKQAGDDEVILGQEGDRDGIDQIIDLSDDETAQEQLREDEMAALYEVRRLRRSLRDRVKELKSAITALQGTGQRAEVRRIEAEIREEQQRYEALILEAQQNTQDVRARGRSRRASSVFYTQVGVARLDGSRVRSEHSPRSHQHSRQGSQLSIGYEEERRLMGNEAELGRSSPSSHMRPWAHSRNSSYHSLAAWDTTSAHPSPLAQTHSADLTEVDLTDQYSAELDIISTLLPRPPEYEHIAENGNYGMAPPYELASGTDSAASLQRAQTRERRIPRRPLSYVNAGTATQNAVNPPPAMPVSHGLSDRADGTDVPTLPALRFSTHEGLYQPFELCLSAAEGAHTTRVDEVG